jgi:hypothetical protein
VLNCVHHIQWVRPIAGGLHQCIQCLQVVGKKDVYPKLEELSAELRARWDAHEASAAPAPGAAPARTATAPPTRAPAAPAAHGAAASVARAPAPSPQPAGPGTPG